MKMTNAQVSLPAPAYRLSPLCSACNQIFMGTRKERGQGRHNKEVYPMNQKLRDVEEAADEICHLCSLRWKSLSTTERSQLRGCDQIEYAFTATQLLFQYCYPPPQEAHTSAFVSKGVNFVEEPRVLPLLSSRPLNEKSSNSQASFDIARRWIRDCLVNHKDCQSLTRTEVLPSRLIDLGGSGEIEPRLRETKDLPTDVRYMSLSHCWGKSQPLRLLKTSFQRMKEGIPIHDLPKSFQEVIETVKRLGCQFIWIDSLCIVQDDEADWRREASRMGDVYRNSLCNIAVTRAPDAHYGCFAQRSLFYVEPCVIRATWQDENPRLLYFHDPKWWTREIEQSPLVARAWVTQELILAPRVLHYAEHQMAWECLTLQANEIFPGGMAQRTAVKVSISSISIKRTLDYSPTLPPTGLYQLYERIVENYSGGALTYPFKDKLLAISGLAKAIGIEDQYVAGLWLRRLPYELLWHLGRGPHQRPSEYQAPSWSWASLNGSVEINPLGWNKMIRTMNYRKTSTIATDLDDIFIEIMRADVEPAGEDNFGPMKSGLIQLRGPLMKALLLKVPAESPKKRYTLGPCHCDFIGDGLMPPAGGTRVSCLPILSSKDNNPSISGLILLPSGKAAGEYVRVGYFVVINSMVEGNVDTFKKFARTSSTEHPLGSNDYEVTVGIDSYGFATYQFTIT